jgi:hypothetical protein
MNKLASIALALTALVATQAAIAAKRVPVPGDGSTTIHAAPNKPDAPLHGEIVSVDPKAGVIVIGRQTFTIGTPQLALIDQRPHPTGLLDLAALEPGMEVRYRTVTEGQTTRVVELWVMRDAPKAE